MNGHRKYRPCTQQGAPQHGRDRRCHGHGNEAAGLPLEQQKLDRQQHRRNGSGEHGRHSRRRTSDEKRFALGRAQVKLLGEDRAQRAAGHDDGAFGAERAAGADGNGGGERLENGDLRLNAAAAEENGFQRLRNSVAANLLRAEARHESDNERAHDRHQHDRNSQVVALRHRRQVRKAVVEGKVGDDGDQPKQGAGGERADGADGHGHAGQEKEVPLCAEIRQGFLDRSCCLGT